jgi:hypothetical protein
MAKIDRYNGNVRAFAADSLGSERTVFGATTQSDTLNGNITPDLLRGWGIVGANENPTKQAFNGMAFTLGQLIAYLHQRGVPEWNSAQEYYQGSVVTTLAGVYRLKSGGDGTVDPDSDGGTNWELAPTRAQVDAKADQATTYTETEVDDLIATRTESPGETAITGTATFTNSTNNIALTGIGSIGLEIGDVVQVTGTASNNKLFTVEVITDSGNVIVNQAHAGGTTSKSLVDETVSATVTLISNWFNAPIGMGQGWVDVSAGRSLFTTYTGLANRTMLASISGSAITGAEVRVFVDDIKIGEVRNGAVETSVYATVSAPVPSLSEYEVTQTGGGTLRIWTELR